MILKTQIDANGMSLYNGTYPNSNGGTELQFRTLMANLKPELKDRFQIICSRVRTIDPDKKQILWLHDHVTDVETQRLQDKAFRDQFAKLVFVSNMQFLTYRYRYGIGYDEACVIPNMVRPFGKRIKNESGKVRLIYHTTPHRGLHLIIPLIERLHKSGIDFHLNVFSSFGVYGWNQRDAQFQQMFDILKSLPYVTYHGAQPNDIVRSALLESDIFLYPCVYPETSCIAAIEAQMAGCRVVCPNLEALIETAWPNLSHKFDFDVNMDKFLDSAYQALEEAIIDFNKKLDNKGFIKHHSVSTNMDKWHRLLGGL
ncbi:glycosyltransferase family 1 protein [Ochrobactrum phage vB_OspM_OC]|nr:glycosyltransferase family 1 protein [Ochrobactrum phage vB_OspM_OC]